MPRFSGPDVVCCVTGIRGAVYHHLYTQKAYPKLRFTEWNLCPLNHKLHELVHKKGLLWLSMEYPKVQLWLVNHGWKICPTKGNWHHELPYNIDLKQFPY